MTRTHTLGAAAPAVEPAAFVVWPAAAVNGGAAPLAGNAGLNPSLPRDLLQRAEDAGLNASAPPQQLWVDGWMVRLSPGKAKRARCINALSQGRSTVAAKLDRVLPLYAEAGLPAMVRITPFSRPGDLDAQLARLGWQPLDDTRVMVRARLDDLPPPEAIDLPSADLSWQPLGAAAMAQAVGMLRGSSLAQQQAHAERLASSPVPFHALAVRRARDGAIVACGQFAREGDLVGIYDVFVAESARGQGLARHVCSRLLGEAAQRGARAAYLQVEADNAAARAVYRRLHFTDAYGYHYRLRPGP